MTSEEKKKLGSTLQAIRNKQKIRQADAAEKAQITESYLSQIENGRKTPSLTTLRTILNVYNYSFTSFFNQTRI